MRPTSTTSPGSMAASSASGSGVPVCSSAIATPPTAKRGARIAIRRHSGGTRSRHTSVPTATIRPAARSTGARGGATVATAIPTASRIAHRSNRTGGRRSRSGPGRLASLYRGKGCYLLQGRRPDPRHLLERIRAILQTRSQGSGNRVPLLGGCHLQSEHPINLVPLFSGEAIQPIRHGFGHLLKEGVHVLFELLYALLVVLE